VTPMHAAVRTTPTPPTAVRSGTLQRCGLHGCAPGSCEKAGQTTLLQRFGEAPVSSSRIPSAVHDSLRSAGERMASGVESSIGRRFGHDFSSVRIHTDAAASSSAESVRAAAYTVGSHIVFNRDRYRYAMNWCTSSSNPRPMPHRRPYRP
jgi:hypothetical protein